MIVALPVDCPLLEAGDLRALAKACADAAVPQTGPLPGAYRKSALAVLERRLAAGELALRDALAELETAVVELDPAQARECEHARRARIPARTRRPARPRGVGSTHRTHAARASGGRRKEPRWPVDSHVEAEAWASAEAW